MKLLPLNDIRYMQYLSAVVATLSMASSAMYMSWTSPVLPQLTSENSPIGITITDEQGSWVAASFLLGAIPGCVIGAFLLQKLGAKRSLLISALPLAAPWIVIVSTKSLWAIYVCRFFGGVGFAIVATSAPVYNGEISENDIRGMLGTTFNILRLAGSLFVLGVGPFVSYQTLALSSFAFPVVFVVLFYFMPESPYYLVKVGRKEAARQNLIRLSSNSTTDQVIKERLEEIESTVEYDMKNRSTLWELFSKLEYRKSVIIMTGISSLQQLSGLAAIDMYMQTIIAASNSSISPEVSSILAGAIQLPAGLFAGAVVDKMGRKPLFIISSLGCAVALIAEGVYFYLQDVAEANVSNISWIPTTGVLLYLVMNPLGVFTLPWILLGELFATNIKSVAVSAAFFYGSVVVFLVVKFFQPISTKIGMHGMFWIFAGCCILGALFCLFVLPETKGKSFTEIQEELNPKRKTDRKEQT